MTIQSDRMRVVRYRDGVALKFVEIRHTEQGWTFWRIVGLIVIITVVLVAALVTAVVRMTGSYSYVIEHVRFSIRQDAVRMFWPGLAALAGFALLARVMRRRGVRIAVRGGRFVLAGPAGRVACETGEIKSVIPSGRAIAVIRKDGTDLLDEMEMRNMPCDGDMTSAEVGWVVRVLRDALGIGDGGGD